GSARFPGAPHGRSHLPPDASGQCSRSRGSSANATRAGGDRAIEPIDLIARLEALDIRLSAEGERLRVEARKGALSEPLRAEIVRSKDEILAFLRRGSGKAAVHARIPRTFDD